MEFLYRPPGYLVQFGFNIGAQACDYPIQPVPWLLEDVGLRLLRNASNRIVLPPRYRGHLREMTQPYWYTAIEGPVCDSFLWRPLYPHE